MKKRIVTFLLAMALLVTLVAPLAPEAQAASISSYEPRATISYDYSPITVCGTIRYVSQKPGTSNFYSKYWGKYENRASYNCSTSCISMALSYIGIDRTPEEILDYNINTMFMAQYGGSTPKSYTYDKLSTAMDNYINGGGKYSPPVIHLDKYSSGGHYVMLIGRVASNKYQVLDPATSATWTITIKGSTATYTGLSSGNTITDTIDNTGSEDVYQWYNGSAALMKDTTARNGDTAKVSVYASGDGLTYTWYYSDNGGSSFTKSDSNKTDTYSVEMTDARAGRKVCCKITDKNGYSITSNTVTLKQAVSLGITKQPKNVAVPEGATATVTVEAKGEGLSYAWYYAAKGSSSFRKTDSFTGNTYSVTMNGDRDGRRLYCVVTDKYGDKVTTETVTISRSTGLKITKQPVNTYVQSGKVATVTVEAEGEGLTYTWYYANKGTSTFKKTDSFKGNTYSVEMNSTRSGRRIYCKVTDKYGNSVTSDKVTIGIGSGSSSGSTTTSKANATVKVTSVLAIRKGAGTGYAVLGSYRNGARVEILETKTVGSTKWGRTSKGWVCMDYVKMDSNTGTGGSSSGSTSGSTSGSGSSSGSTTTSKANATVKVTSVLAIRKDAGTSYAILGSYRNGARVEILETKTVGSTKWGRTSKGWICMDYVKMDSDTSTGGSSSGSTSGGTSSGTTTTTKPNATVKVTSVLAIRDGAGTGYAVLGSYKNGARVEILETKTVGSTKWGKTSMGWICMDYVKMDSDTSTGGSSSGGSSSGSSSSGSTSGSTSGGTSSGTTTTTKPNATVKVTSVLAIRNGAGTSYGVLGSYKNGARIEILETKTVGSTKWGRTSKGWVCMDYVKLDSDTGSSGSTSGSTSSGSTSSGSTSSGSTSANTKTVDTTCLLVRETASTSAKVVGYYYKGDKVEIKETKTAGGYEWGKTTKGWIALKYTK